MIKFSLKTTCLILLSLFSVSSFANSPWAEAESSPIAQSDEKIVSNTTSAQTEANSPAAMQDKADTAKEESAKATTKLETKGDVFRMPTTSQASGFPLLDFPRRGMTTSKVENELGRPIDIVPAVGTPPISRWIYNDRVVFFEGSSVIHVVAR